MFNLITAFELISTTDWLRIFLVYGHLVFCVFAISAVLKTDIALILGNISRRELESTARSISVLLLALWATGLAIIYLDTGFDPDILLGKSKLLFKLMCVTALTLNGLVLHHLSFPVLKSGTDRMTTGQSILLVTTGALSTSHWMLAAFVGMSRPLGRLPFATLCGAYSLFVLAVLVTSLFFIPLLSRVNSVPRAEPA